jgi:integrase
MPQKTGGIMAQATFQVVAREWWERYMLRGSVRYAQDSWRKLEQEVMPELGGKPLAKIDAPMILGILRRIEAKGTIEVAHKVKAHISQVMRYGIACGLIYSNPARDLTWALTPKNPIPRAALLQPLPRRGLLKSLAVHRAYEYRQRLFRFRVVLINRCLHP